MSSVKDLNKQVKELDARIQELEMQRELILASIGFKQKNVPDAIEHFAKAVDYGYLGNYSFIGGLYGSGEEGVPVDLDKAKHYLQKFYDDYKLCRLEDVSPSNIVTAIYNLAATESYICIRDGVKHSAKVTNRMKRLFIELINIAEIAGDDLEESAIEDVFKAGAVLYSGLFGAPNGEDVEFKADTENGIKGLKVAADLGNESAKKFISFEGIQ